MDTLGKRLRFARKKKGYTQAILAGKIGVSRGVIFNLEKDKTEPQAIVINAVCQTLQINKDWLLYGTGEMENSGEVLENAETSAALLGHEDPLFESLVNTYNQLSDEDKALLIRNAEGLLKTHPLKE